MKKLPKYPSLYQINTRVWLTELSSGLNRKATLDDIPDDELDRIAALGFDWVWFLSVWTTGQAAKTISRNNPQWREDFENTLPDLKEEDIEGSGFAIVDYHVHPDLGGDDALQRLRTRLSKRGLRLMLDFVPNHMAPDHKWVESHPEYFIEGSENDLENKPHNYTRVKRKKGDLIFAYGRDKYFDGWPDTIQLDYSNPATVEAMKEELLRISDQCDGVRCDMAMLVLPEVFEQTWGRKAISFWPEVIKLIREKTPGFCFMAEVYWDMEWELQQMGFDYAYDKTLYDRLEHGDAKPVREHFFAGIDYQDKLARFLENHDEQRAAQTFSFEKHRAAAVITYLSPGLRFFHQGQFEGRLKRISPHLIRGPKEMIDNNLQSFYLNLLEILKRPIFREGKWLLLRCSEAWENNHSFDSFLAFAWEDKKGRHTLVIVNYAPHASQCMIYLPFDGLDGNLFHFRDIWHKKVYVHAGDELAYKGLFIDLPAWSFHIFEISVK